MRSYLYVPGNRPQMLTSALSRGADALIVDLEDAVPPAEKPAAREAVARWLRTLPPDAPVHVRVNSGDDGLDDARAVVCPALRGLTVAKADTVGRLAEISAVLDRAERAAGLHPGAVDLVPLLETATAILSAPALAAAPRVRRLQIGEADLAAELGVTPGEDERELLLVRSAVVLASAAAGIEPPAAAVTTDFRDLDRLRRGTIALKRMGFRGRACIHPAQIPVVNEVFTPTGEELAAARDLVSRFEAAGGGVCLDARGRMVDLAVVREARRTLAAVR
ncbi:HpcH/HpaI aldolase/citrate lyase family protein [Amorphoplanes digitatis]|uniref:Citrate lyase subunit beta/citryl-CoA lyase n=1 Tax=Actinoplanes digitatis TaxID=1868 RepID=A0A7W7HVX1_9ACTN|nr:CoA ester lyase [Actinoplanes digitatis]MBB4761725.1 citrate lyase subunit beta/citryl-CoA lyase [Actinoplanes digitatis]GID90835.1 CoA ester lyase [Actinoplanes digitatis]